MLVATLVGLVVLLAGCSTQRGQAVQQVTGGSVGRVGDMAVLDAVFAYEGPIVSATVYEPGDTVELRATVVNTGDVTDQLVSVSSPIAGGGLVLGSGMTPGQHALTAGHVEPIASISLLDTTPIRLLLTDLTTAIRAGLTYPVVFTFARAGEVRLELHVENPDVARAECPLPPDGKVPKVLTAPIGAPAPPTPPPASTACTG